MQAYRPPRKYVIVLALVSAVILVAGSKLRPQRPLQVPPSAAEMLRLQTATQRRNLEDLSSFFANVANGVQNGVIWVAGLKQTGVGWEAGGLVVTGGPSGPPPPRISARGRSVEPEILSSYFPVAAVRTQPEVAPAAVFRSSAAQLAKGSWVLHVMVNEEGEYSYVPGSFGGVRSVECGAFELECLQTNLPLGPGMEGSGVFDMDRNLVGLVVRCGAGYAVITPSSVEIVLKFARSFTGQLLRRYGFRVTPLSPSASAYFKTDWGLLVTEVHQGRPAFAAGLTPGDVIQGLDDHEVRTEDDLARLVLPVAYPAFDLWVWRNGETVRATMPATDREFTIPPAPPAPGILLRPPLEGFPIHEILPGSPAEQAELRPGDRLLRIGDRAPRNLAEAERILTQQAEGAVHLTIQRGARRFGVLLQ